MNIERSILSEVSEDQGWSDQSKVEVLISYIESLNDPSRFLAYVSRRQEEENGLYREYANAQG